MLLQSQSNEGLFRLGNLRSPSVHPWQYAGFLRSGHNLLYQCTQLLRPQLFQVTQKLTPLGNIYVHSNFLNTCICNIMVTAYRKWVENLLGGRLWSNKLFLFVGFEVHLSTKPTSLFRVLACSKISAAFIYNTPIIYLTHYIQTTNTYIRTLVYWGSNSSTMSS